MLCSDHRVQTSKDMLYRSGRQIALARQKKDMTSQKLSRALGITAGALSTWETGAQPPGYKLIKKITPDIFGLLDPLLKESDFWRALHYERYIANLIRPGPHLEYTIRCIDQAIFSGLREYPYLFHSLNNPIEQIKEEAILLKHRAFLWYVNAIDITDFQHNRSKISPYMYVTQEIIQNLTTSQKIDFILALFRMIGFDYGTKPNALPIMVFTPWIDPNKPIQLELCLDFDTEGNPLF